MELFNSPCFEELVELRQLFDHSIWLNDDTQRVMIDYISRTNNLMEQVVHMIDCNGEAGVIPSYDLGISYNTSRIAGGFTTGMIAWWECDFPFVPIDITIKECSGSVIKISHINEPYSLFRNTRIETTIKKTLNDGYSFSFSNGNHFFALFEDTNDEMYLVIHCGDDSFRDEKKGVYPSDSIWYKNEIKTFYDSDYRYLKYLVGKPAEKFTDISIKRRDNIKLLHRTFAENFLDGFAEIKDFKVFQHYGFKNENIVLLGTGLIEKNEQFPIFSKEGVPIIIVKPSEKMWGLKIDNTKYYIVPHGWGQVINRINGISNSKDLKSLIISTKDNTIRIEHGYNKKISHDIAMIREIPFYEEYIQKQCSFEKCWNNKFYAELDKVLYPIVTYSEGKVKAWR